MSTFATRFIGVLSVLTLSACLGTDLERAGGGALIGGVAASALSGNVAGGALLGAAVGALADDLSGY
ncbi:hypothetical protein [Jannaschia seosinensis]|nr:hypothetical protein [Jannaschia seosinensis]